MAFFFFDDDGPSGGSDGGGEGGGYDEAIEACVERLQEEILSDEEASSALMKLALPISHHYDRDQQAVADDISAAFEYRMGSSPDDYADTVRSPSM